MQLNPSQLDFKPSMLVKSFGLVLAIWIAFWADLEFGLNMRTFGILPESAVGLRGVIFAPFVHGDLGHLTNNSISLFALLLMLFYFYERLAWQVLFWGLLGSGIATWVIGRPAFHIGASGIVYMLVSFLFFKGIITKYYRLIALSLVVVFLYGGLLWYMFEIDPKISWEGHLSGFFVGFLLALVLRVHIEKEVKYAWEREDFRPEDDPFISQFDEDGNFIETPKEPIDSETIETEDSSRVQIRYVFKKNPPKTED